MSEARSIYDDEIDIFEFFKTLWKGKLQIGVFFFLSIIAAVTYLSYQEPVYESRLKYSLHQKPSFYDDNQVISDFDKIFLSKESFSRWEKNATDSTISYESFDQNEVLNGYIVYRPGDERLARLEIDEIDGFNYIYVKTDDLKILQDFYSYAQHVNSEITASYLKMAKKEIEIMEARSKDLSNLGSSFVQYFTSVIRYVESLEGGERTFVINRPSEPTKVFPRNIFILMISAFIGVVIGSLTVLLSSLLRQDKE